MNEWIYQLMWLVHCHIVWQLLLLNIRSDLFRHPSALSMGACSVVISLFWWNGNVLSGYGEWFCPLLKLLSAEHWFFFFSFHCPQNIKTNMILSTVFIIYLETLFISFKMICEKKRENLRIKQNINLCHAEFHLLFSP